MHGRKWNNCNNFQDGNISRRIGKTVYDIQAVYPQVLVQIYVFNWKYLIANHKFKDIGDEPFPDSLKELVNQKFKVSILLEKDNILKGSTVYKEKEILQNAKAFGTYTLTKDQEMEIKADSMKNVSQILFFLNINTINITEKQCSPGHQTFGNQR